MCSLDLLHWRKLKFCKILVSVTVNTLALTKSLSLIRENTTKKVPGLIEANSMCPAHDNGISDLGHAPGDMWLQHHLLRSSTMMLLSNPPKSNIVAAIREDEIQVL